MSRRLEYYVSAMIIPIHYIECKPDSDKYRIRGKGVTVEFLAQFINDPEWTRRARSKIMNGANNCWRAAQPAMMNKTD